MIFVLPKCMYVENSFIVLISLSVKLLALKRASTVDINGQAILLKDCWKRLKERTSFYVKHHHLQWRLIVLPLTACQQTISKLPLHLSSHRLIPIMSVPGKFPVFFFQTIMENKSNKKLLTKNQSICVSFAAIGLKYAVCVIFQTSGVTRPVTVQSTSMRGHYGHFCFVCPSGAINKKPQTEFHETYQIHHYNDVMHVKFGQAGFCSL